MKKHLIIIGPQGSGKTTRAFELANAEGPFSRVTYNGFFQETNSILARELKTLIIEVEDENVDYKIEKYLVEDSMIIKQLHRKPTEVELPRFIFCCQKEQLFNFPRDVEIEIIKLKG